MLNAVDVRSESRHDDPVFCRSENGIECRYYGLLRRSISLPLCIGAVSHQEKHAVFSDFSESLKIDRLSLQRSIIDLEISRMKNDTGRRRYRKCNRSGHGMCHAKDFHPERSEIQSVTRSDRSHLCIEPVFLQFIFQDSQRKLRAVDRNRQTAQKIRDSSDMVFMSVCDDQSLDFFSVIYQI